LENFKSLLLRIVLLNSGFLSFMSAFRFAFFKYYGKGMDFSDLWLDVLKAFYMGIRYDLSVLAYLNVPVVSVLLILLFANGENLFRKCINFFKYYYTLSIGSLIVFLSIDFGFYSYFQNHLNVLVFGLFEDDTAAIISTLSQNYSLFLVISWFILSYTVVFFVSKYLLSTFKYEKLFESKKIVLKLILTTLMIFINIIVARGSLGYFSLKIDDLQVSKNVFLNKVSINGVYTFENALELKSKNNDYDCANKAGYKNNIRKAFADYLNLDIDDIPEKNPELSLLKSIPYNKTIENVKPNVILIVMESFGSDLLKYNSENFNVLGELKKHFDADFVFYNFLPAHDNTIGSLEGIITNVARLPLPMFLAQSRYAYKKYIFSGPMPYNEKGYETTFIYGGNNGWRNLCNFIPNLGFNNVLGEGNMDKNYSRGVWGVYDECLFDYLFKILSQNDNQKFICVLSTTNHPPYSMPSNYKKLPLNIPKDLERNIIGRRSIAEKRFITYQYSNEMLGRFITRIKNSKYANNTIIAVTGDHNFGGILAYSNEKTLDSLSVPFYLYIPKLLRPASVIDTSAFGSHLDIMPTLYNLSISNSKYIAMGRNIVSEKAKDNIISIDRGVIMNKEGVVRYDFFKGIYLYYIWNKNNNREIKYSYVIEDNSKKLIKHYLSAITVSEYLIKSTGKNIVL